LEFHHVQWSNISVCIDGIESRNWRFCLFKLDEMHLVCMVFSDNLHFIDRNLNLSGDINLLFVLYEGGEWICSCWLALLTGYLPL
jgi:hypothetical protein